MNWPHAVLVVVRVFFYALVTAFVTLGLAFVFLSTPDRRQAESQAFQEIEAHRVASRCMFAEITAGLNTLLDDQGLPTVKPVDLTDIPCSSTPPILDPTP